MTLADLKWQEQEQEQEQEGEMKDERGIIHGNIFQLNRNSLPVRGVARCSQWR